MSVKTRFYMQDTGEFNWKPGCSNIATEVMSPGNEQDNMEPVIHGRMTGWMSGHMFNGEMVEYQQYPLTLRQVTYPEEEEIQEQAQSERGE
jgi:hypothetical protein